MAAFRVMRYCDAARAGVAVVLLCGFISIVSFCCWPKNHVGVCVSSGGCIVRVHDASDKRLPVPMVGCLLSTEVHITPNKSGLYQCGVIGPFVFLELPKGSFDEYQSTFEGEGDPSRKQWVCPGGIASAGRVCFLKKNGKLVDMGALPDHCSAAYLTSFVSDAEARSFLASLVYRRYLREIEVLLHE